MIFTNADDPAEHLLKLTAVLETLRAHELLIKGSKTELFRSEVECLGFELCQDGWEPTESKVAAIVELPAPETVKHLRSFLGMAIFFRTFIPVYSEMAAPLTELLKKTKWGSQNREWSVACQTAFMSLKAALTSAPVLHHFDPTLRTAVYIDGSQNAVGAVLLQWQEGEENPRPVAYMSRKSKGTQYRYDARNVEALAAKWHCRHGKLCYWDRNSKSIRIMTVYNTCLLKNHPRNAFCACVSFWRILTSMRLNITRITHCCSQLFLSPVGWR